MSELPKGWSNQKLGDVVDYGKTIKVEPNVIDHNAWILELEDVEKGSSRLKQRLFFAERKSKSTKNKFSKGDVLYGKLRPYLDKVIIAEEDGYCSTEIIPIKPGTYIDNRYLFYSLKRKEFLEYVESVSHGLSMPRLGTKQGQNAPFILAPLNEQIRIANKLDSMLAKVDAAQARLDKIPNILKRFRQSVLASATSGVLTKEWRGDNEHTLDGYPLSWNRKNLDDIGELSRGKSKHRPRNDPILFGDKWPFIQTGEVAQSSGEIVSASKWLSDFGLAQSRLFPQETLCITIAANIADTAILKIDACFPDSVVGFTANRKKTLPLFVKYLIDVSKDALEQFAPSTAQKNINLKVLKSLLLPIPELDEQKEIVRRVESLFAMTDAVEKQYNDAKARTNHLTQSILAKAFRGELLPQDSNDEPASELLRKLKASLIKKPAKKVKKKVPAKPKKPVSSSKDNSQKEFIRNEPEKQVGIDFTDEQVKRKNWLGDNFIFAERALQNLKDTPFTTEQFQSITSFSKSYDELKALILTLVKGIPGTNEPLFEIADWDEKTGNYSFKIKD